ncbi:MAG: tetratricopeptide repeat protein, partial [Deltaproteobacteria bacterium]|nr:tetratricopeptide repeat protein [Deltaproteobacteria bacterium]
MVFSVLFTAAYAGVAIFFKKNRVVFLTLLWIVAALIPALYIPVIPGGFAERYFYLPSVASSILVIYVLQKAFFEEREGPGPHGKKRARAVIALITALLTVCAIADVKRASIWKNDITLWGDTVKKVPDNPYVRANLAWGFHKQGDKQNAIKEYKEVIRIGKEKTTESLINLASIYMEMGNFKDAIATYGDALKRAPNNAGAHYNIAMAYTRMRDLVNARIHYKEVIRQNPWNDNAYHNLAWTYQESGDYKPAIVFYTAAIKLAPQNADSHYNLGIIYEIEGLLDNAIGEFDQTLKIN